MSYSHMGTPTLPSALTHFTSEFGMESGGATSLLSLDKKFVHGCTYVATPWMAKSDVLSTYLIILESSTLTSHKYLNLLFTYYVRVTLLSVVKLTNKTTWVLYG